MKVLDCENYNVVLAHVETSLQSFLEEREYSKIAILVDENTRKYCLPRLMENLDADHWTVIEIKSGEQYKSLETCEKIWNRLLMVGFDRHSLLINLGGGVIGDMGGFCAATYMRGIDFVQIPTTVLAQVDSSVGGKLGVDLQQVKNIVGLFANPAAVFVDNRFLSTLPESELKSGFAEIVKHALIADNLLWNEVLTMISEGIQASNIDDEFLAKAIEVKRKVVIADPYEKGLRKTLNFGHTIGHAVETQSWRTENPLLHGEAIYVGMICENYLAFAKSLLSKEVLDEVNAVIKKIFYVSGSVNDKPEIWELMTKDKKNKLNKVYSALIDGIGSSIYNIEITREEVMNSLSYYQNL